MQNLAKIGLIATLVLSIGIHWAFLQSAAWVSMIVSYTAETGSLSQAVEDTFDGDHPCRLCRVVEDNHKQDQKKQQQDGKLKKLDLVYEEYVQFTCPKGDKESPATQLIREIQRHDLPSHGPPRGFTA